MKIYTPFRLFLFLGFIFSSITCKVGSCSFLDNFTPFTYLIEPSIICTGDQVACTWNVGTLTGGIEIEQPDGRVQTIMENSGSISLSPTQTGIIKITHLVGGNPDNPPTRVRRYDFPIETINRGSRGSISPRFDFICPNNAYTSLELSQFSSNVVITNVINTNPNDRNLTISHGGITVQLAPDRATSAFNGLPVKGLWVASQPLVQRIGIFEGCRRNNPPRDSGIVDTSDFGGATIVNPPPSFSFYIEYTCN